MTDNGVLANAEAFRTGARSLFDGLRHWLAGTIARPARFHPVVGLDMFLDPARLSRHFKAPEQGSADGYDNLPPVDADQLTTFEVAVRMKCNDALLRLKRQTNAALISYEDKLFAIDIRATGPAFLQIEAEAERRFQTLFQTEHETLIELRKDELLAGSAFRQFKSDERLKRDPQPLRPVTLTPLTLALMIALEAAANTPIFAPLTSFGKFGGFTVAALVASFNVLFAFCIGMFLVRNWIHRFLHRRILAGIATLVAVALLLFFQFDLAKFRALALPDTDLPTVSTILKSNVDWTLPAGALLVVSLGFAAFAITDGFCIAGDPYPNYSAMARRRADALLKYRRALLRFKNRAVQLITEAKHKIQTLVTSDTKALFAFKRLTTDYRAIVQLYEQNAHQIENACNHVIKEYRDKNIYVRTRSAPTYFDVPATLDWAIGREIGDPGERLAALTVAVDDIAVEAENAKTRLHNMLVRQLQEIEDDLARIDNDAALLAEREQMVFKQASDLEV